MVLNVSQARLLKYYSPLLSATFGSIFNPERVQHGSVVDQYIHSTCERDVAEFTVLHRLQSQKEEPHKLEIASECSDHLSAGTDTTGDTLCFLMWKLSQLNWLPIQDRLREELLKDSGAALDNPHLGAVIKEGLRSSYQSRCRFPGMSPIAAVPLRDTTCQPTRLSAARPSPSTKLIQLSFPSRRNSSPRGGSRRADQKREISSSLRLLWVVVAASGENK